LEKNRLCDQIAVKTLLLLASLFFATCFCPPIRADDQIKDASPDGKFAMLLTEEWLKSGALVVVNDQGWETWNGDLRGCTQTVTVGFDAKHKASVLHVAHKKPKEY
jgi:hypothetical protein